MSLTKEKKKELIQEFQKSEKDCGSSEVQVAILTKRISELTEHLSGNPKDYQSQRGLLTMVGQRKKALKYLNQKDKKKYRKVIDQLGIRG